MTRPQLDREKILEALQKVANMGIDGTVIPTDAAVVCLISQKALATQILLAIISDEYDVKSE